MFKLRKGTEISSFNVSMNYVWKINTGMKQCNLVRSWDGLPSVMQCPIHTADADATPLSSCVVSALWTHPSAVVTQFTISRDVELLRLVTSDDNDVIVEKISTSIKIHVVKPLSSFLGDPVHLWVCATKAWSISSACKDFRAQHPLSQNKTE